MANRVQLRALEGPCKLPFQRWGPAEVASGWPGCQQLGSPSLKQGEGKWVSVPSKSRAVKSGREEEHPDDDKKTKFLSHHSSHLGSESSIQGGFPVEADLDATGLQNAASCSIWVRRSWR